MHESEDETTDIFQSLVATVKFKPAPDIYLGNKSNDRESAGAFLHSLASFSDDSLTEFIQSIGILLSSASQVISTAAMKMLLRLISYISPNVHLSLVKADLIHQLIASLNVLCHSFDNAVDIHNNVMIIILDSLWLSTPYGLGQGGIEDLNEQQAVHETVFRQVIVPSEKYISHLCVNRKSIIDGEQSRYLLTLLAKLLQICPYFEPTMECVLLMPIILMIPSCLTFFEKEGSINWFLLHMNSIQQEWNQKRGEVRQLWRTIHRMLRMEGIEDVMAEQLQNDRNGSFEGFVVAHSIQLNNQLGVNLPK
ncbi:hypothetical protein BLNAU_21704 [Blattamonas nauphoetae]|uniref:Uncharacterized protein n=1 Tax=Blattamonas nauphoetae TaxID=2049346 RepID=A0ABQ9WV65_9EUKA|nr:hypothetical protein BLNAU_21704 [Blattamonas nauphoetae]